MTFLEFTYNGDNPLTIQVEQIVYFEKYNGDETGCVIRLNGDVTLFVEQDYEEIKEMIDRVKNLPKVGTISDYNGQLTYVGTQDGK